MRLAHIDELDAHEMPDGFVWRPVRRHFGIRAFGTNAYTPGANGQIVEEHTERRFEHEEIYLVLRGRVRFTVDGNEHELAPGELVFVRDPSLRRGAVALTDDAAVLAVGGKPGEPFQVSTWEEEFLAFGASHPSEGTSPTS
jgi:quercetin dioxygenase-like cupin family protein